MQSRGFFTVLAVAAFISAPVLSIPAFAQSGASTDTGIINGTVRQPTGAVVPEPPARGGVTSQGTVATTPDTSPTGTVRSRDTTGLPQSPENLNVLGCRQIDPLCQNGR